MKIHRRSIVELAICLWLLADATYIAEAQSLEQKVIYEGLVRWMAWSSDSQRLSIIPEDMYPYPGAVTNVSTPFYDVTTQSLSHADGWPFQPALKPAEQAAFMPVGGEGESSLMYASPNNRYVVYAKQTTSDIRSTYLTIGSRDTLTAFTTDIWVSMPYLQGEFVVHWSKDSSSFAFDNFYNISTLYYGTKLSATTPTIIERQSFEVKPTFAINGVNYFYSGKYDWVYIDPIYDISNDGSTVLTHMEEDGSAIERLIAWNPTHPASSRVIQGINAEKVLTAKFVEGSSSRVIFIDQNGLFTYDLDTGAQPLVTSSITAKGFDVSDGLSKRAVFSPNNRWLAIKEDTSTEVNLQIILIDLQPFDLNGQP